MSPYKLIRHTLLATLLILSGLPALAWSDGISSSIIGTWVGPCFKIKSTRYIKSTAIYRARGKYEDKTIFYKNAACTTLDGGVKTSKGTYRLGKRITTPRGKTAYFIDLHYIHSYYNSRKLPSIRLKNIINVNGNTMIMGQITPRTLHMRPTKLDPTISARRQ